MARATPSWTDTEATDWAAGDFVEVTKFLQQILQNLEYLAQSHDHTGDPDGLVLPITSITAHAARHAGAGADDIGAQAMAITGNWDVTGVTGRVKIQTGAGVPSHSEAEGTLYWDTTGNTLYCNNDGATAWTEVGASTAVQVPWALWVPDPLFTVGNAVWNIANRGIFLPFTVPTSVTVTTIRISVVTQSGNLDVGIYDESRTKIVSLGSTAVGAVGSQVCNIADTVLAAGRYYFAMVCDNVTANFARGISFSDPLGRWQYKTAAFPLPAGPVTFDGFVNYAPVAVLHISGGIA